MLYFAPVTGTEILVTSCCYDRWRWKMFHCSVPYNKFIIYCTNQY